MRGCAAGRRHGKGANVGWVGASGAGGSFGLWAKMSDDATHPWAAPATSRSCPRTPRAAPARPPLSSSSFPRVVECAAWVVRLPSTTLDQSIRPHACLRKHTHHAPVALCWYASIRAASATLEATSRRALRRRAGGAESTSCLFVGGGEGRVDGGARRALERECVCVCVNGRRERERREGCRLNGLLSRHPPL